jgi:hypothetical protein
MLSINHQWNKYAINAVGAVVVLASEKHDSVSDQLLKSLTDFRKI